MHPYAIDEMVQERQRELRRLRTTDVRADGDRVPAWRRQAGRALASLAVTLGVPAAHRPATRRQVGAALCLDPPC